MKKEDKVKELFEICGGTFEEVASVLNAPIATVRNWKRPEIRGLIGWQLGCFIDSAKKRTADNRFFCSECEEPHTVINTDNANICYNCGNDLFRIFSDKVK